MNIQTNSAESEKRNEEMKEISERDEVVTGEVSPWDLEVNKEEEKTE